MERRLHAVPARPTEPIAPARAIAHVAEVLPELDEPARIALALAELSGREADAEALYRARKALRRTIAPLPGTGWCERAERLISDELDVELPERSARLLESHLERCERCVEHERKLAQARDDLVRSVPEAPAPPPVLAPEPPAEESSVVSLQSSGFDSESEVDPEPEVPAAAKPDTGASLGSAVFWGAMIALSVVLAIASVVILVLGASGALQHTF